MKNTKILKIVVDVLMFVTLIVTLATMYDNLTVHTIIGFVFAFFVIVHTFLNAKWIVGITKNFKKVKRKVKVQYIVNMFLTAMWIITVVTGIVLFFVLLNSSDTKLLAVRRVHEITGMIASILTVVHIFQHRKKLVLLLKSKKKSNTNQA